MFDIFSVFSDDNDAPGLDEKSEELQAGPPESELELMDVEFEADAPLEDEGETLPSVFADEPKRSFPGHGESATGPAGRLQV